MTRRRFSALAVVALICGAMTSAAFAAVSGSLLKGISEEPPAPPKPPAGAETTGQILDKVRSGDIKVIDVFAPVPQSVEVLPNIKFGKGGEQPLELDLYKPKVIKKPVPALVFIHGGGWKSGRRNDYRFYCLHFAEKGYVAATITYRLSKEAPFPAAVQDVKCAIRWLRANAAAYGIDPTKIAVVGGSAGGHLSLMAGYAADDPDLEGTGGNPGVSSRVQAVVDLYGPADLTTPVAQKADVVLSFLGDKTFKEAPKLYAKASPLTYLTKDAPPTLIFQGTVDEIVPVSQSDVLASRLAKLGVPYLYDRLDGWPHAMDVAQDVNTHCIWFMERFFAQVLPLPK